MESPHKSLVIGDNAVCAVDFCDKKIGAYAILCSHHWGLVPKELYNEWNDKCSASGEWGVRLKILKQLSEDGLCPDPDKSQGVEL